MTMTIRYQAVDSCLETRTLSAQVEIKQSNYGRLPHRQYLNNTHGRRTQSLLPSDSQRTFPGDL